MVINNNKIDIQTIGARLKYARRLTALSIIEFCRINNFSYDTYMSWENNNRNISHKKIDYIITCLLAHNVICSKEWIINCIGDHPNIYDPQMNTFDKVSRPSNSNVKANLLSEIDYFLHLNPDATTMIVQDDSMAPLFEIGDYVGGIPFEIAEAEKYSGSFCIIQTGNQLLLRRFYHLSANNVSLTIINISNKAISPLILTITDQKLYRVTYIRKL